MEKAPIQLKEFKGCTIDFRLKEVRKVDHKKNTIEFIKFESKKGKKLLEQYYKEINSSSAEI